MKEYKFRGKKASNGEWVYGYLAEIATDWDFYNGHGLPIEYSKVIIETNLLTRPMTTIAPETIGQYTGLKDKNGTKIYEGDILKHHSLTEQMQKDLLHQIIGKAVKEKGMTYIVGKMNNGYLDEEIKTTNYKALLLSPELFEIIGNIHENPELMEVK